MGALAVGSFGLAACGNLTAGGSSEVEVVVASDESGTETATHRWAPAPDLERAVGSSEMLGAMAGALTTTELLTLEGTVRTEISVSLTDAVGNEVDLTDGVQEVMVSLAEGARTTATLTTVPAGEYQVIRARFHRVEVEVISGPGVTLPLEFELDLGDGAFEIESTGALILNTDERARIVVDLQVGRWVLTPAAERSAIFRDAVTLSVEAAH
jgi:hypothetical protein